MELKCCSVENPLLSTVKTVSNLVGYNEKISWVLNFERCFFLLEKASVAAIVYSSVGVTMKTVCQEKLYWHAFCTVHYIYAEAGI